MQPLDKSFRNTLEKTIKSARDIAESAARIALEQLGVGEPTPYSHLTDEQRKLRRKLRAHGRQLGNGRDANGRQALDRLIEEVAYEHWHRMLFARFLAENNLLMYPDPVDPVAVTLQECEDLAADEGAANGWELAARYATRMLPQIFRPDSPVFQLTLPPEHQQKLERLVADLPLEVFAASDSLGWVYQFWQAKKKDEIDASEKKIGARELPVVTQLFTEPYMVSFLLDNSIGAWWAARRLSESDFKFAISEDELRKKAAIPGVPLEFLRFVQQEDGSWTPAAGNFPGWPGTLSEFKILDPCCGSGHFLVAAFLMLVSMRMVLEGLSACEAAERVLCENIHGLELDRRCVELAAFALALTAWLYPGAGGYRPLPKFNVACSGLSISAGKEDWLTLSGDNTNLGLALEELYQQFKSASVLGSLINIEDSLGKGSLFKLRWEDIIPLLTEALINEKDEKKIEIGVVAQGVLKTAQLLANKYHYVVTNVPYLTRNKQEETLRSFCERQYKMSKSDLSTVFLERCLKFCTKGGTTSVVIPQNWMFLTSYRRFRESLLKRFQWNSVIRLGFAAFDIMDWWAFNTSLVTITNDNCKAGSIFGLDVSNPRTTIQKSALLRSSEIKTVEQAKQFANPDARVILEEMSDSKSLAQFASSFVGIQSGDSPRFIYCYWETGLSDPWHPMISTTSISLAFGGMNTVMRWGVNAEFMKEVTGFRIQGLQAFNKNGVLVGCMKDLPVTSYMGSKFDNNSAAIIPDEDAHLLPIWCFCSSPDYNEAVRRIDQKLNVTNATLVKVPFDLDHWTKVAEEKYPNGLPKPYTNDPTQWIFHGHPCGSVIWDEQKKLTHCGPTRTDDTVLHVSIARLLGYRWPAELDADMELAVEQCEWVNRCKALLPYADDDGIVCIPPVRGELSVADRLMNLLVAAYGDEWSGDMLAQLLKSVDHEGKSLETWLRDKFFIQHCKLFHHRPFIWHIWDGLGDGFAALVNYHKLDHKNLETLIYTYLGDWINRQTQDIANGIDGAQERLDAAQSLKKKLELILEGEAPHDIFVRWKPIEEQPIGWNPDLNDGVRLNIRPFMTVGDVKKRGAGVLRDKPNIKWTKDRGKDVTSAPWYHLFKGDRLNDHHLSLTEKQQARREATRHD